MHVRSYLIMRLLVILIFSITSINAFSLRLFNHQSGARLKRDAGLSCPHEILRCNTPLQYSQTQHFECKSDELCPGGYKCCQDSCFQHSICKKNDENVQPEYCTRDNMQCLTPLNYEQTRQFLCYNNDQCPQGYQCCQDSCFWHKVCKKSLSYFEENTITPFIVSQEELGNSVKHEVESDENNENKKTVNMLTEENPVVSSTESSTLLTEENPVVSSIEGSTVVDENQISSTENNGDIEKGIETIEITTVGITENNRGDDNENQSSSTSSNGNDDATEKNGGGTTEENNEIDDDNDIDINGDYTENNNGEDDFYVNGEDDNGDNDVDTEE